MHGPEERMQPSVINLLPYLSEILYQMLLCFSLVNSLVPQEMLVHHDCTEEVALKTEGVIKGKKGIIKFSLVFFLHESLEYLLHKLHMTARHRFHI